MKHVKPVSRRLPVSAFTINWKCIPCILLGRFSGDSDDEIRTECEAKIGAPCVT